jgi:hypothetical protein
MKKVTFSVVIAILSGIFVLFATFFPSEFTNDLQGHMVDWAVILAGISMLVGIFNLLRAHWIRMGLNLPEPPEEEPETPQVPEATQEKSPEVQVNAKGEIVDVKPERKRRERKKREKLMEKPDSAVLLIGFVVTFFAGMFFTPANAGFMNAITAIQVPVESSLLAMVSVVLLMTAFNFFQRHHDLMGFMFIGSVLVFLILGSGLLHSIDNELVKDLIALLNSIPLAGTRGILIGIALGSVITALRQLLGFDRAYRE